MNDFFEHLFKHLFQILDIPGISAPVICDLCKSKVEMFIEFKKNCISCNDRLINKDMVKLEAPPIETSYELWCQNSGDYEIKPVIDEVDHLFEIVDAPIKEISKMEKSSTKKTKSEREVCSYCGKTFLFLSQHLKSMHSGTLSNTKTFSCGLCFEKFTER